MNKEWEKELKFLLEKKLDKDNDSTSFVFIDKNHPPNGIDKSIRQIKTLIPLNFIPRIVAIIPKCQSNFQLDAEHFYPFSLTFMINCLQRVQTR